MHDKSRAKSGESDVGRGSTEDVVISLLADVFVPTDSSAMGTKASSEFVSAPDMRLLLNELVHELFAFGIVEYHYFNATLLEVILTSNESLVLRDDDLLDFVHDASAGAHVTWR